MALESILKTSPQKQDNKTPKATQGFWGASIAGTGVNLAVSLPAGAIALSGMNKVNNLPQDKIDIIHSAYDKIIKETGLGDKGVKLVKLADTKVSFFERLKTGMALPTMDGLRDAVKKGANAFYNTETKEIIMPAKQLSTCSFHEIGHAMNANLSKIGPKLQKMRNPAMLAASLMITYCALTRNKKPDENGEISTAGKINNFIRNNSGKLAFLATTPILLEEGMASVKGQKLAKKFLTDKNLIKTVKINNILGYLTYLSIGLGAGLGAWATTKIKDKIQAQKEAQLNPKNK
jgi:hypothetical protein